jgi:S-adenosylmethionine synthetase
VLDEVLRHDRTGRVACETFVTTGLVVVGGEITTRAYVDIHELVRRVVKDIGYTDSARGFAYDSCAILNAIGSQSPDIAQGVDTGGAGDQGLMTGYACRETRELMPMPIMLAHRLTRRLAQVRKRRILGYLGPDGKSQVTMEYLHGVPHRIDCVVLSTQHTEEILDRSRKRITRDATQEIVDTVIKVAVPERLVDKHTRFLVNPTGKFVIGGPQSDTGMTGRKIMVDTYGGMAAHGGGAFSGKDPSKVDRSAAYMARYVAKNVVASRLAEKCTIQLAYAIGVAEPVSLMVFTDGTAVVPEKRLEQLVRRHCDLTPRGIIKKLKLLRPIYSATSAYGHFGRTEPEFTWEQTDLAGILAKEA